MTRWLERTSFCLFGAKEKRLREKKEQDLPKNIIEPRSKRKLIQWDLNTTIGSRRIQRVRSTMWMQTYESDFNEWH